MRRRSSPKSSRATATEVRNYAWADLRLSTDLELPELPVAEADAALEEWTVTCREGRPPLRVPRCWFHRWRRPDGQRALAFARIPGGYLLRFIDLADFEVRPDARRIDGYRPATTPGHTFNHLLLDQVLPLAVPGRDRLSLHASVAEVDGGAVAFLGGTQQGKSTLAAALMQRGHTLLSDDCCVIHRTTAGFDVIPTYPGLRLFPETVRHVFGERKHPSADVAHYSTKQRIVPESAGTPARVPLRCVYTLAARDASAGVRHLRIDARSRRDAVLDLVGGTFYLDVRDARRAREGFELAAAAASACAVRLLTLPWNLDALDSVVDAIAADQRR
jgi:hypothetical protein